MAVVGRLVTEARALGAGLLVSTGVWSQLVEGAPHPSRGLAPHVGVDHGRADIAVAEELLDRADVLAGFEQVGREAVAVIPRAG